MRIFIDTEFLNRGHEHPIELISIGLVRDDGQEFYGINVDAPLGPMAQNSFIRKHIWPTLPLKPITTAGILEWDRDHADIEHVMKRPDLVEAVYSFLTPNGAAPDLWGTFAGFDYVVLSQLWGTFDEARDPIPMWINDIRQEIVHKQTADKSWALPPMHPGVRHHALHDARGAKALYDFVMKP